jgi:hypothetical protein
MSDKQDDYASYLLRLWKVEEDGQIMWRASLEDTRQADRRNFPNLAALIAFLQAQFETVDCPGRECAVRNTDAGSR